MKSVKFEYYEYSKKSKSKIWLHKAFKILLLTYKALNNMAPSYITSMFTLQAQERYSLRSNTSLQLKIPRTKYKTCGDRAFPVAAATLWNRLPYNIRDSQSIDTFKSRLKTFLFSIAFEL